MRSNFPGRIEVSYLDSKYKLDIFITMCMLLRAFIFGHFSHTVVQGGDGDWLPGWDYSDFGSSPGWWAATVAAYSFPSKS